MMIIKMDFKSDEALYVQLRNQIIRGIATAQIQAGETLPSVRQLAEDIGINMHTVNKAYTVLKKEGILQIDRRRGTVISIDVDHMRAINEMSKELEVVVAKGRCKNITKKEMYTIIEQLYDMYD